jgi:hypothetical protein
MVPCPSLVSKQISCGIESCKTSVLLVRYHHGTVQVCFNRINLEFVSVLFATGFDDTDTGLLVSGAPLCRTDVIHRCNSGT